MSTPQGGGFIIFAFSAVRTLGFRSFERKVFILSFPNLVWVFIKAVTSLEKRHRVFVLQEPIRIWVTSGSSREEI